MQDGSLPPPSVIDLEQDIRIYEYLRSYFLLNAIIVIYVEMSSKNL